MGARKEETLPWNTFCKVHPVSTTPSRGQCMQACSKQPPIGRLPLGANLSTLGSSRHTGQDQKPPSPVARSHHGRFHPWQRSCGRDLTGKVGSGLKGPPESARASTPKPKSVCLTILCLSPTLLTLTGGYPWPPFSGKNKLRALVNGHERNISIQTPLMAF